MNEPPWLAIAAALALAKLLAEGFHRLKLPSVLGELLAGLVLGNLSLLFPSVRTDAVFARGDLLGLLAELGAVVLLFQAGLESDARRLLGTSGQAARVAVVGVIGSLAFGYAAMSALRPQSTEMERLFVGAVLSATSVGVTARVLRDLRAMATIEARVILAAAVIDDVLGLVVLAVALGLAERGRVELATAARLIALAVALLVGGIVVGRLLAKRLLGAAASHGRTAGRSLTVALTLCFAFAWAAHAVGLAPIVGAFAAGLLLDPGIGMIPRGEVGLIIAFQGTRITAAGRPLVAAGTFAALILVVLFSWAITPPLLAFRRGPQASREADR